MKTQNERVLEALLAAPGKQMMTHQLHKLPFITNVRARISNLRQKGHIIECKRIKGTDSSIFTYLGHFPSVQVSLVQSDKEMFGGFPIWHKLPNNFEVQYV